MTHGLVSGAWPRTWPSLTRSARHLCMHTTTAAALSRKLRGSDSPRAGLSPGTEDPSSFCLPMHPFVYPRGGSTPPLWPLYVPLCTTHSHSLGQNSVMGLLRLQEQLGNAALLGDQKEKGTGFSAHGIVSATVHPSVHRLFSHFISCLSHRKHRPPPKWDGPKPSRGCRPLRGWALGSAVQSSLSGPDVVPSDQWPWPTGQAVCPLHSLHFSGVGAGYPKLKFPFGKGRVEEAVLAHGNFRLSQLDLIWPLETLLYVSLFLACKNSMLKRMLSLEAPQLQILIPPGASLEAWDCFTI